MAEATLNETLLSYVYRRNMIDMQIAQLNQNKLLAVTESSDLSDWKIAKYKALRSECQNIFSASYMDSSYKSYTEIPEYTEEVEYIDCYFEAEKEDMADWESALDNEITALSVELSEINTFVDSYKNMMSDNIKRDYNYAEGL